jgi:serine/threonine protein phosphatase PrpC
MIRFHARSHPGVVRPKNEDAMLADGKNGVFVVADGVGGRAAGEVASALVVDTVEKNIPMLRGVLDKYTAAPEWDTRNQVLESMDRLCQFASKKVFDEAERRSQRGMTTTLVLLIVGGGTAFLAHVGDSRAYLVRDGLIHQLTEDHSMVNELVRSGQMTLEDAKKSQYRNVITRAIGLYPSVQADSMAIDILPGDRLMLCSDGLCDPVSTEQLEALARQGEVEAATDALLQAAIDLGARDNVTVALIEPEATPQTEAARARAEVMESLFLFKDLPFHHRLRVARICEARAIDPREVLASQGEPGDAMYVIVDGRVEVEHNGIPIASLSAGEHFGEISLLDAQPRSATVTSMQPGSVIVIRREAFEDFCQREPELGSKLLFQLAATLAIRLRLANERMTEVSQTITI